MADQLTEEARDQRECEMEGEEQTELLAEFGLMVAEVEAICKPRMLQHSIDKIDKDLQKLRSVSDSPVV